MLLTVAALAAMQLPVASSDRQNADMGISRAANGEPIRSILFIGTDAPSTVARAAESFIGKPNTKQTLAELVGALSRAYESSPVALYTIAIPEQDFHDGIVKVALTEAGVEQVLVEGKGAFPRLQALALPLIGEAPLKRATFERQILLMRTIPGVKFDFGTENPDLDDDVTVRLKASRKRIEAAVGLNNRGPDLLGDVISDARLDFNSLALAGDRLRFSGGSTLDLGRLRQFGASYEAPIGSSGLTASSSITFIRTRAKQFDLEGKARVAQIALTYPLLRSFHRTADLSLSFDGVNSSNALFGNVISNDRIRSVRAAAGYGLAKGKNRLRASMVLSKGLDALGARVNPLASEASFLKANASFSYERDLFQRLVGRLSGLAQYSGDRLPASELISIGGATVGRAFDTALLSGDKGAGAIGELAFRPIAAGPFGKSEVYGYADAGQVKVSARSGLAGQRFDLASAGVGIRANWKEKAEFGAELGRVVDPPYPGYDQKWRLSLSYRLVM